MSVVRLALTAGRAAVAATVLARLARAVHRAPLVRVPDGGDDAMPSISVVVPARDEAARIGPLLSAVVGAPGVTEVLVVDDCSSDETARLAIRAGADVVTGRPLPPGWVGKAWTLEQGLRAATGEWIVSLDADTRPSPELPSALVARALADGDDLLTVAGRFECPTAALRWLHPAMLTTLVYRTAPPGSIRPGPVSRRMGNGQCMAWRRRTVLAAGGFGAVAHHTVEDVALVRTMAAAGFRVDFLDARGLLTVRMYESAGEAWTGWGRSIALPGVDSRARQIGELAVVVGAQVAPMLRLLTRRADALDGVLGLARLGTLVGTSSAYRRRDAAYWASPLADAVAVAALAVGIVTRERRWRGRSYGPSGIAVR